MLKPKLSIYVGESQISVLKFVSPDDFRFFMYPYSVLSLLFHNRSEKLTHEFFLELIQTVFVEELGIDNLNDFEVIVGGLVSKSSRELFTSFSIEEALSSIQNYSWMLVEESSIQTPSDFLSFLPLSLLGSGVSANYFSNKALYPQVVSSQKDTVSMEVNDISKGLTHKYDLEVPLVFTGGIFSKLDKNSGSMYLTALNFLKFPGFYNVRVDTGNKFQVIGLLNCSFNLHSDSGDAVSMLDDSLFCGEFFDVGTVLRTLGPVECLFEHGSGSPQFVEMGKDEIFIFPLDKTETARVSISSAELGKMESNVRGGDMGFVLDTRDSTDCINISSCEAAFNERLRAF